MEASKGKQEKKERKTKIMEWRQRSWKNLSVSRRNVTRAKRVEMRQRRARTPSHTIAKCLSSSVNRICFPHLDFKIISRDRGNKILTVGHIPLFCWHSDGEQGRRRQCIFQGQSEPGKRWDYQFQDAQDTCAGFMFCVLISSMMGPNFSSSGGFLERPWYFFIRSG